MGFPRPRAGGAVLVAGDRSRNRRRLRGASLMIGVVLLTFFRGRVGGSETYARGLLGALHHVGKLQYRVMLHEEARGLGGGLEESPRRYAGSRERQIMRASLDPVVRRELSSMQVVHYPLTV